MEGIANEQTIICRQLFAEKKEKFASNDNSINFILLLLYTNNAAKFYHSHYRKEHKDMLASFGLTEDSNFPTAAFLPVKRSSSNSLVINIIYFKIFTY